MNTTLNSLEKGGWKWNQIFAFHSVMKDIDLSMVEFSKGKSDNGNLIG